MKETDRLVRLPELARELAVSLEWLRRETDAGRLPHLRAGRQRLYSLDAVRRALSQRAGGSDNPESPSGARGGGQ